MHDAPAARGGGAPASRPLARIVLHPHTGRARRERAPCARCAMTIGTLLLILLLLALVGTVPAWPYSRGWGYTPSGALGAILLVVLVLVLLGRV
jgi:hypothetical protein